MAAIPKVALLLSCLVQETVQAQGQLRSRIQEFTELPDTPNDRDLQQYVISIPILPIIVIICLCVCLNKRNEEEAATRRLAAQSSSAPNQPQTEAVARVVTAAVTKCVATDLVGIGFAGTDHAKINSISANSLFKDSALSPGMKVVSVNNIVVNSKTEAQKVVRESKSTVSILAHSPGYFGPTENLLTATIVKELPDQSTRTSFKNSPSNASTVFVSRIDSAHSPFVHTDLAVGMEIVAINNTPVKSATHAAELTRQAFPLVTLLVRRTLAIAVAVEEEAVPSGGVAVDVLPAEALVVDAADYPSRINQ